jgi:hypothetical protein
MLEIEKQQRRFPGKSLEESLDDYERDMSPHEKEEERPLPNSPYREEGTLPLKKKDEKSD